MIFSVLFIFSLVAAADEPANYYAKYAAAYTAYQLAHITSAQDLPQLLKMNEEDLAAYQADVKKGLMKEFIPPQITMPSETKISIRSAKSSLDLEYLDFAKGYLYIGRTKVHMDAKMSYASLKSIVDSSLRKYSRMDWFLPEAEAAGADWMQLFGASTAASGISASMLGPVRSELIEDTLINGWKTDAKNQRFNRTLTFSCTHKVLGVVKQGEDSEMEFIPDQGYKLTSARHCENPIETDIKGKILKSGTRCVKMGENLFFNQPFFQFPKLAAACCAKDGCFEKVSAAYKGIAEHSAQRGQEGGARH
ncbi:MAG: hypothetical protein ACXWQE_10395 [Bdellovibrionales bacterium]